MFKKLLHNLSGMLKNGGERWSSNRFCFVIASLICNFSVFGMWIALSIHSKSLVTIPESVIVLYALASGISVTSKLVQKPLEKK